MDRRDFLRGVLVVYGLTKVGRIVGIANAEVHDKNNNKINDDLERMIEEGTYPRYLNTNLAHVLVKYQNPVTEKDRKLFEELGGIVHDTMIGIVLDGGLPPDKIVEYAIMNPNVSNISPNYETKTQTKK